MSLRALVLLAVAAFLLLGGGGFLVTTVMGTVDRVGQAAAKREICSTLDEEERLALVGKETPTMLLDVEGSLDPYTCRWSEKNFETGSTFVQAISAPAHLWAAELRSELWVSDLPRRQRRALGRAVDRAARNPDEACGLLQDISVMGGGRRDVERIISPGTSSQGHPMMTAMSCRNRTYTTVMVVSSDLVLDRGLARRAREALHTVEVQMG